MPIIKHAQAEQLARNAIVLDLGDLQRQADAMRRHAEEEASRILADARLERERIIEGAQEKGFSEGYDAGQKEGEAAGREAGHTQALAEMREELKELGDAWMEALGVFAGAREELLREARQDLLLLVADLARRVVGRVVETDPSVVEHQLRSALDLMFRPTMLRVRLHSDHAARAETVLPELARRLGSGVHAEIETDDTVARTDVIVHTEHGEIDVSIGTQLDRLAAAIVGQPVESADESAEGRGDREPPRDQAGDGRADEDS